MEKLEVRPMEKADLDDICQIERALFPDPWSANMFSEQLDLSELYSLITILSSGRIIGYGGLLGIQEDGHITNLAVHPSCQEKGVGTFLIFQLVKIALYKRIKNLSLEVRTTNEVAHNLYRKFGFKTIAIRKNYYGYEEDAIIMSVENIDSKTYQEKLKTIEDTLNYDVSDGFQEDKYAS